MTTPHAGDARHRKPNSYVPQRRPNADLRTREHLTEAEVQRLMDAARKNRWGHRDGERPSCCYYIGRQQPSRFGRRPVRWFGHRSAHDVGLNHDVVSTTNQHKMFGIVTANR